MDYEKLIKIGHELAQAGIAGNHNPGMGTAIAWDCEIKNMSPIDYDRKFTTIMGRVSPKADAMLGDYAARGGKWNIRVNTTEECIIDFEYKERKYTAKYSMEDARRNGWCFKKDKKTLKENWLNQPENMLLARCISLGLRRIAPEIMHGIYSVEEMQDLSESIKNKHSELIPSDGPEQSKVNISDFSVCPIGKNKGHKWGEFTSNQLLEALKVPAIQRLDRGYIEYIELMIEIKKNSKNNK